MIPHVTALLSSNASFTVRYHSLCDSMPNIHRKGHRTCHSHADLSGDAWTPISSQSLWVSYSDNVRGKFEFARYSFWKSRSEMKLVNTMFLNKTQTLFKFILLPSEQENILIIFMKLITKSKIIFMILTFITVCLTHYHFSLRKRL